MTAFALHLLGHGAAVQPGTLLGRMESERAEDDIATRMAQAAELGIAEVTASDLRRARLAGEVIATAGALPLEIDPRWRELDFGDSDGSLPDEIDPDAMERFRNDPEAYPPSAGERWSALVSRVLVAIAELSSALTLVVTHGGAKRAALHLLCDFDQRRLLGVALPYGTPVSLRVRPETGPTGQVTGLYS